MIGEERKKRLIQGILIILTAGTVSTVWAQSFLPGSGLGSTPDMPSPGELPRPGVVRGLVRIPEPNTSRPIPDKVRDYEPPPALTIELRIYNYADLPDDLLAGAEAEASSIFRRAGVRTLWIDCPRDPGEDDRFPGCRRAMGPRDFVVRIASRAMAESFVIPADAFGFGLPCATDYIGCYANVFPDRVAALAADQVDEVKLMGHVLAHEIGHLLLGPGSHSVSGIMRGKWDAADIEAIRRSGLIFTTRQSRAMRDQIQVRTRQENIGASAIQVAARAE